MLFDPQDYERNRAKYRLYRTAVIAESIHSLPELTPGQCVAIEWHRDALNKARGAIMPIYKVRSTADTSEDFPPMVFACALADFSL
jgi:hypothetical protein